MDFHPILVHFPIALLTIYALLELARFKRLRTHPHFFYVKATFAVIGSAASIAAATAGLLASRAYGESDPVHALIGIHRLWALTTVTIFLIPAFCYLVAFIEKEWPAFAGRQDTVGKAMSLAVRLSRSVLETRLAPLLALAGLFTVTVTGALGGSIIYGPSIDPFVTFIYGVFGPK